jgi:hypothetical protein
MGTQRLLASLFQAHNETELPSSHWPVLNHLIFHPLLHSTTPFLVVRTTPASSVPSFNAVAVQVPRSNKHLARALLRCHSFCSCSSSSAVQSLPMSPPRHLFVPAATMRPSSRRRSGTCATSDRRGR